MTFLRTQLPNCTNCAEGKFFIKETRKAESAVRRRRMCDRCGHRDTVYEVSAEFFQEAKANQQIVSKLKQLVGSSATLQPITPPQEIKCTKCYLNKGTQCSFELPEYNTQEAFDCIHFAFSHAN